MSSPSPALSDALNPSNVVQIRRHLEGVLEQRCDANKMFAHSASETDDAALQDFSLHVKRLAAEISTLFPELLNMEMEDLEACLKQVEREINVYEEENVSLADEVDSLSRTAIQESLHMESSLRSLYSELEGISTQVPVKSHSDTSESQDSFKAENINSNFEILKLKHFLDTKGHVLSSLQQLHDVHESEATLEFVEDIFSDIKIIDHKGIWIKLLVKTFISKSVDRLCRQLLECGSLPHIAEHELLIEVDEETLELKNVKIFPDDVYIGEMIEAAKSMRLSFLPLSLLTAKSPLGWLLRKIQYRIFLCSLRLSIVNAANKSRHSFEYCERDDVVIAHLVEGVDALIKISGSWPASNSALKLVSLVNSEFRPMGFPVSTLCRVQELANSLPEDKRQNLVRFVDAMGAMLLQQDFC